MSLLEMHHHTKPAPPLTRSQRRVIERNRREARNRSGGPSTTAQADPFTLCQPDEAPDPFE